MTRPGPNLRTAAVDWLTRNNLFDGRYGIEMKNVYFEGTRDEKVARIKSLGASTSSSTISRKS